MIQNFIVKHTNQGTIDGGKMMRKPKSNKKTNECNSQKPKISLMIWEFAGDFIRMGESIDHRQSLLNAACTAWNISLLKRDYRDKAIRSYIDKCQELNPGHDENYPSNLEGDIRLLIKEKDRLFPEVKKQLVNATIQRVGENDNISVLSAQKRI